MRVLLILVCLFGCGVKEDPKSRTGSAAAPVVAREPPPIDDYDARMKAGTALEDQKKWAEALVEFEAALNARSGDALALAEIGFTAFHAGNLERAKEASEVAILAATDPKVRGSAMYNLGLAIEPTLPHAAATLYVESNKIRPNATVRARLTRLQREQAKAVATPAPDGDALLGRLQMAAAKLPPVKPAAKPLDQALIDALDAAGVQWESGAGKSVLLVSKLECRHSNQTKPSTYECTNPAVKDKAAQALVANLSARKIAPSKEHGDVVTFTVAEVKCTSLDEGDSGKPDSCAITK
jgi:tetratricopeptide (TPR) repeat protein